MNQSGANLDALKASAARGSALTLAAQAYSFLTVFASVVVLARVLTPAEHGLVAIAVAVTAFVERFSDLGLSLATVQRRTLTREQISNLFWINTLAGALLGGLACAAGPLVAKLFAEPRLTDLIQSLGVGFIFAGLGVQHLALLRRRMQFERLALVTVGTRTLSVTLTIGAALAGWGYWALVVMQLTPIVCMTLGAWIACPFRPRLYDRATRIGDLARFGADVAGFNVLAYLLRNVDKLLLGWWHPSAVVGYYSRAYQFLLLPLQQVSYPLSQVAIPALSRLQHEPGSYAAFFRRATTLASLLIVPLVAFLFVSAENALLLALGEQWHESVPIFRWLSVAAAFGALGVVQEWVCVSRGLTSRQLRWQTLTTLACTLAFACAVPFGAQPLAITYSATLAALFLPGLVYILRGTPLRLGDVLRPLGAPLAASIIGAAMLYAVQQALPAAWTRAGLLAIEAVVFGVTAGAGLLVLPGRAARRNDVFVLLRNLRRRDAAT